MNKKSYSFLGVIGLLVAAFAASAPAAAQSAPAVAPPPPATVPGRPQSNDRYLTVWAGSTSGVYYYVAAALCDALHQRLKEHRIHCTATRTMGSSENIKALRDGRAKLAILQSNQAHAAATGTLNLPKTYSVMSLHNEAGVLMVHPDSDIYTFTDVRGHRLNVGTPGSSARSEWEEVLRRSDMSVRDLSRASEISPEHNKQALCDGFIDGFAGWIGHPALMMSQAAHLCKARALGFWSPAIEQMLKEKNYLFHVVIPAETYPGQTQPLDTYGFKAVLVATEALDPDIVYQLTKAVFTNFDYFRSRHATLKALDAAEMVEKGNFLPFHAGAMRFYREVGWVRNGSTAAPTN